MRCIARLLLLFCSKCAFFRCTSPCAIHLQHLMFSCFSPDLRREALRVMGNPESETFQAIVKALHGQKTAEHVEHWYDNEPLKTVASQMNNGEVCRALCLAR